MTVSPKYVIVAIACCAVLTSCTSTDSADGSATPSSTQPPASSTAPPTTTPTTSIDPGQPQPPELPPLAREKSTAGAKAFIRHYVDAVNYGFASNEPGPLLALADSGCSACQRLVRAIRSIRSKGGSQEGGEWKLLRTYFVPIQPASRPIALLTVQVAAGFYWASESDGRHRIRRKLLTEEIRLAWDDGWRASQVTTI